MGPANRSVRGRVSVTVVGDSAGAVAARREPPRIVKGPETLHAAAMLFLVVGQCHTLASAVEPGDMKDVRKSDCRVEVDTTVRSTSRLEITPTALTKG